MQNNHLLAPQRQGYPQFGVIGILHTRSTWATLLQGRRRPTSSNLCQSVRSSMSTPPTPRAEEDRAHPFDGTAGDRSAGADHSDHHRAEKGPHAQALHRRPPQRTPKTNRNRPRPRKLGGGARSDDCEVVSVDTRERCPKNWSGGTVEVPYLGKNRRDRLLRDQDTEEKITPRASPIVLPVLFPRGHCYGNIWSRHHSRKDGQLLEARNQVSRITRPTRSGFLQSSCITS